ncbi:MAG: hypothetical protein VKL20_04660 [Synechocystis sp.]|nr:hypothetical protein [Synechocystis sp.]
MISVDLTLKYSPLPVSVQRKEKDDAETLYQAIIGAMQAPKPQLIELTCEKQTEKKVALMSDQISAVIVSQKDGAAAAGNVPGFAAIAQALG